MNRSGGVVVFEVVNRSPPLGYAQRYPTYFMIFYTLETEYNRSGDLDWSCGSYEGEPDDLDVVLTTLRLSAIWNPPEIQIFQEKHRPNVYSIDHEFGLDQFARDRLKPFLDCDAELLPLSCSDGTDLCLLHPLYCTTLDDNAEYRRGIDSGNLIEISRYSFPWPRSFYGDPCHLFRIRNFPDSPSGTIGCAFDSMIVSGDLRRAIIDASISGVTFTRVHEIGG